MPISTTHVIVPSELACANESNTDKIINRQPLKVGSENHGGKQEHMVIKMEIQKAMRKCWSS